MRRNFSRFSNILSLVTLLVAGACTEPNADSLKSISVILHENTGPLYDLTLAVGPDSASSLVPEFSQCLETITAGRNIKESFLTALNDFSAYLKTDAEVKTVIDSIKGSKSVAEGPIKITLRCWPETKNLSTSAEIGSKLEKGPRVFTSEHLFQIFERKDEIIYKPARYWAMGNLQKIERQIQIWEQRKKVRPKKSAAVKKPKNLSRAKP